MNSWKYESRIKCLATSAITTKLSISNRDIYKTLKDFNIITDIIETKDGKKYKLVLEEI